MIMELQYFQKELVSNPFMVAGKTVQFEVLGGNRGVIALNPETDGPLVDALNKAAAKRRGGVIKITSEQYLQKKTLFPNSTPFVKRSNSEKLRALPPSIRPAGFNPVAAVAGAAKAKAPVSAPLPPPVQAPAEAQVAMTDVDSEPRFKPATRRISRKDALGEGT